MLNSLESSFVFLSDIKGGKKKKGTLRNTEIAIGLG